MKASELYIKGGNYEEADRIFSQSLSLGNSKEKSEMKKNFKEYYITQAKIYLNQDKRNYSRIAFEKALTLDLDIDERRKIQKQLLDLYDKLGMIKEFYSLKGSIEG